MAGEPTYPGVYVEESSGGAHPIAGVDTSTAAFVDCFTRGPTDTAVQVAGYADFERVFGGLKSESEASYGIQQFFLNGGRRACVVRVGEGLPPGAAELKGVRADRTGMFALEDVDLFNILCIPRAAELPPADMEAVVSAAEAYCRERRAFMIVDIPGATQLTDSPSMQAWMSAHDAVRDKNAAIYFPRVMVPDPLNGFQLQSRGASGTMAGVYAATDIARGVWHAPAGAEARLHNVPQLAYFATEGESVTLNQLGINLLRTFPADGTVPWGARTLVGSDQLASEWRYVPVRRLALFLEESIYRGTKWAVFEPNDEPLWAQLRLNVGAFMYGLFRQGAFRGQVSHEAYFVKCDTETTTRPDIDNGVVNILVGFAPLKPGEFVIIRIEQHADEGDGS